MPTEALPTKPSPCLTCGACCSYSKDWPRFTTEDDAALECIPPEFVSADLSGMRCNGDRCTALVGEIGKATSCALYDIRPDVCRACQIGDDACQMARARHGLPPIVAPPDFPSINSPLIQ